jgi:hypothetical protein
MIPEGLVPLRWFSTQERVLRMSDSNTQLRLTDEGVTYYPGDKWSCGLLDFEFETPLGLLTYVEKIPGPRHGEDSGELTMTLDGVDLCGWWDGGEVRPYPDFEAPGKPGRWAEQFEAGVVEEVKSKVEAWFGEFKGELADYLAKIKASSPQTPV